MSHKNQLNLWDYVPRAHVRSEDPHTSKAAAGMLPDGRWDAATLATRKSHAARIFQAFQAGLEGTYEDAAITVGLHYSQTWKRISDLLAAKLIEPTGETRTTELGKQAQVYRLSEKGRTA